MVRKIAVGAALLAAPIFMGVTSQAAHAAPVSTLVTQASSQMWVKAGVTLNVRSGPGVSYSVVGTVKGNTALTGVVTNGWMKITSGSLAGRYVSAAYLTSVNLNPTTVTRWVTATTLNVRAGAGTSYAVVGTLAKNAKVVGVVGSNGWMRITEGAYANRYVSTSYLTSTAPTTTPPTAGTMWVKPGGPLNVRSAASSTASVVGSLYGNTKVTGTVSNGWMKLSNTSYVGRYVPVTGLTTVDPAPNNQSVTRWVASGASAAVRQSASSTGTLLATLPANTEITGVLSNGWIRITAGGHLNHYVSATGLSSTRPTNAKPISVVPVAPAPVTYPSTMTNTPEWKCQVKSGDSRLQDWPAKVRTRISKQFGITNIGGYRATATGEHGLGLALDVMMPSVSNSKGDAVATWTVANARALNVKYVIWKQAIWLPNSGWKAMEDRGDVTQNHYDHVHISFNSGSGTCPA